MATTLITISGTGEHLELVVLLAALVSGLLDVKDRGSRHLVGGEATLRATGTSEGRLLTEKVGVVLKELVGGAEVLDGALAHLLLHHNQVVDGIEVILITQNNAGEVPLLGGVPLGGEQKSKALTGIGGEACKLYEN